MSSPATRCIIVTGASRGIGAAITAALLTRGHTVIALSRQTPATHPSLIHYPIDLGQLDATARLSRELTRSYPVDAVICNAGRGDIAALENFSAVQIEASLQLNLISPLVLVRELLPVLRSRQRSDIIFTGSESALTGGRFGSLYSAAKFGLRGAAQALRAETARSNCHVGIVQPGMVRSSFFEQLPFAPGDGADHALHPDDVAAAMLSMLDAGDHAVLEEIIVNPRHRVVQRKT